MRSVLAVLAGYATLAAGVILSTALASKVMIAKRPDEPGPPRPTPAYLAVNLLCGAVFAALGGFVAAWLAPGSPMVHSMVLAGLMAGMAGLMFLEKGGVQPTWYKVALLVLGPISALIGGMARGLAS